MAVSRNTRFRFPSTNWSAVAQAARRSTLAGDAMDHLLRQYLGPLRAHLLHHKKLSAEQADEFLQAFISEKVLQQQLLASAQRQKGKFRTFLLVALDRFVSNQLRNQQRRESDRESPAMLELTEAPDPTPSAVFEIAWARQVLASAAARMKEQCQSNSRDDIWAVFEARVLAPNLENAEPVAYEQLVKRFELASVEAASNLLVTAKRMFARSLSAVVGEYMQGDDVDREIADLRAILARARK